MSDGSVSEACASNAMSQPAATWTGTVETYPLGASERELSAARNEPASAAQTTAAKGDAAGMTYAMREALPACDGLRCRAAWMSKLAEDLEAPSINSVVDDGVSDADPRVLHRKMALMMVVRDCVELLTPRQSESQEEPPVHRRQPQRRSRRRGAGAFRIGHLAKPGVQPTTQCLRKRADLPCRGSPTPLLMPSSSNLPNNSELEREQDHEYFLNRLPFSTWRSFELSPFVHVSMTPHNPPVFNV